MSSSISFISKTPFLKSDFLSPGIRIRRRNTLSSSSTSLTRIPIIASLTKNPAQSPNNPLQLMKNNQYYKDSFIQVNEGFHESGLTQLGSISDEDFINVSMVENEIKEFVERLERVVEEFRILEMEKLMNRAKGGDEMKFSVEEAEIMSREIVCKFLEKPIKYLSSACGNGIKLEDKLKDLKILVRLLEDNSCLEKQSKDVSKSRSLCLRQHSFS